MGEHRCRDPVQERDQQRFDREGRETLVDDEGGREYRQREHRCRCCDVHAIVGVAGGEQQDRAEDDDERAQREQRSDGHHLRAHNRRSKKWRYTSPLPKERNARTSAGSASAESLSMAARSKRRTVATTPIYESAITESTRLPRAMRSSGAMRDPARTVADSVNA